jgi:hypothetical protein
MRKAQMAAPLAKLLTRGRVRNETSGSRHVIWRILILAALLAAIAVPLKRALTQLASETVARSVIEGVLKNLAPADALVSQSVQIGRRDIDIRVISTQAVSPREIQRAEKSITDRTKRKATVSIEQVASRSELAEILSRLNTPATVTSPTKATPPQPKSIDEIRQALMARVSSVLSEVWPKAVTLQSFAVALDQTGIVLNVKYQAESALDKVSLQLILNSLRNKLQMQNVALVVSRDNTPKQNRGRPRP